MDSKIQTMDFSLYRELSDKNGSHEARKGIEIRERQRIYSKERFKSIKYFTLLNTEQLVARWDHIRQKADKGSSPVPATKI